MKINNLIELLALAVSLALVGGVWAIVIALDFRVVDLLLDILEASGIILNGFRQDHIAIVPFTVIVTSAPILAYSAVYLIQRIHAIENKWLRS